MEVLIVLELLQFWREIRSCHVRVQRTGTSLRARQALEGTSGWPFSWSTTGWTLRPALSRYILGRILRRVDKVAECLQGMLLLTWK